MLISLTIFLARPSNFASHATDLADAAGVPPFRRETEVRCDGVLKAEGSLISSSSLAQEDIGVRTSALTCESANRAADLPSVQAPYASLISPATDSICGADLISATEAIPVKLLGLNMDSLVSAAQTVTLNEKQGDPTANCAACNAALHRYGIFDVIFVIFLYYCIEMRVYYQSRLQRLFC